MTPIVFDECFGWLHAPPHGIGSDVAVVICPGLMRDALLAHCSLRLLGDELAAAGYWALRFDYPGTGDSGDGAIERAGGHWAAWQESIDAAANWLRATSGAQRLVLCGLRTGATLAALSAARRDDVAGLLLFEPVVSGRTYVRELILEADLQSGKTTARGEGLEIREFHFSADTLDRISGVDLRKTSLRDGQKAALFVRPDARQIEACVDAWNAGGADSAKYGWDGLVPLMRHSVIDENELANFTTVMRWIQDAVPPKLRQPGQSPSPIVPASATLTSPHCIETPLRFGPDGKLFGMLCRPTSGESEDVVIVLNGGRDPHYGAARQAVSFARRLAQRGVSCLRLDFAGLGDSLGPPGKENVLSKTFTDRNPDIHAAVDALHALGFRRFTLQGLCSGAYHAYHGALNEPRINTLLLVNIALFTLPQGDVLEYLEQRGRSPLVFLRKLFRLGSWMTLLSGKADIGTALKALFSHVGARLVGKIKALARRLGLVREQSFALRSMGTLSKRGVRTLYLFSPGETEIETFAREFGPTGAGLKGIAGARMHVVPGMDHDLTKAAGRHDGETVMIDFVVSGRP